MLSFNPYNLIQQITFLRARSNKPKEFHGSRDEASSFLAQCHLVFATDPVSFADDRLKINYIVSFLRGDAFKWYDAVIYRPNTNFANLSEFEDLFKSTFGEDPSIIQDKAFTDLRRLSQTKSCQLYATKFIQLSARVFVDEATKMFLFKEGLKSEIKLHLIGLRPSPRTLSELIHAAVEYDDALFRLRMSSRAGERTIPKYTPTAQSPNSSSVPMDIDATSLKPASYRRESCQRLKSNDDVTTLFAYTAENRTAQGSKTSITARDCQRKARETSTAEQ